MCKGWLQDSQNVRSILPTRIARRFDQHRFVLKKHFLKIVASSFPDVNNLSQFWNSSLVHLITWPRYLFAPVSLTDKLSIELNPENQ